MKNELLIKNDFNVILLSWHHGNNFPYIQAAANTRIVAAMVSLYIVRFCMLNPVYTVEVSVIKSWNFALLNS